jgi:hypothetical protein
MFDAVAARERVHDECEERLTRVRRAGGASEVEAALDHLRR